VDTTLPSEKAIVKPAFFLERKKTLLKRAGLEKLPGRLPVKPFLNRDLAVTYLFQALVDNIDWQVGSIVSTGLSDEEAYWNIEVFQNSDISVAVPYDFDLAGFVTGRNSIAFNSEVLDPEVPDYLEGYLRRIETFKTLFKIDVAREASCFFISKGKELTNLLKGLPLDEKGREMMLQRTKAFLEALQNDPSCN
jgi:hypothetical protein